MSARRDVVAEMLARLRSAVGVYAPPVDPDEHARGALEMLDNAGVVDRRVQAREAELARGELEALSRLDGR